MDCSEGCPTAAVMFGVPGVRVLAAERERGGLRLTVETNQQVEGCYQCVLGRPGAPVSASWATPVPALSPASVDGFSGGTGAAG